MSKVTACIIGDTHIGHGRDNKWMGSKQSDWFTNWFFPLIRERRPDYVIQTGDFFDSRKHIQHTTMQRCREVIISQIQDIGIPWIIPPGNHDIYHRESIIPNSPQELLGYVPEISVLEHPTTVKMGNTNWDFIPWICASNREEIMEFIKNSTSEYCVGHFELGGFLYYPGIKSEGSECGFLSRYRRVYSGHYHTPSSGANVQYVGTPYTLTLGDADDQRGVWFVDVDDADKAEFVAGPGTWHVQRQFDANTWTPKKTSELADRGDIVAKLLVLNPVSGDLNTTIETVQSELLNSLHDVKLKYADGFRSQDSDDDEQAIEALRARSPMSILKTFVDDNVQDAVKRQHTLKIVQDLYAEAQVEK